MTQQESPNPWQVIDAVRDRLGQGFGTQTEKLIDSRPTLLPTVSSRFSSTISQVKSEVVRSKLAALKARADSQNTIRAT